MLQASFRAANPPDFRESLPILRPTLRLYDSAVQTPDFSHIQQGPLTTVCGYEAYIIARYRVAAATAAAARADYSEA